MRWSTWIATGLILLLGAAAWIVFLQPPDREGAPDDSHAVTGSDPALAVSQALEDAAAAPRTEVSPSAKINGWAGTVLGPNGESLGGALVRAELDGRRKETTTDSAGRFLLVWPVDEAPPDSGPMAFFGGMASKEDELRPPEDPPAEVVLRLLAGMPVEVQVVDEDELPVPGVEVSLSSGAPAWFALARTDEAGRAVLHAPVPGLYWVALTDRSVLCDESVSSLLVREGDPPSRVPFVIRRHPPGAIWLSVVDDRNGFPLSSARFRRVMWDRIDGGGRIQILEAARPGLLRWDGPPGERPLVVLVDAPGFVPMQVVASAAGGRPDLVRLAPLGQAIVRVLRRGEPASGIRLEWSCESAMQVLPEDGPRPVGFEGLHGSLTTDSNGEAVLPLALDEDHAPFASRFDLSAWNGDSRLRDWGSLNIRFLGGVPWELELEPSTARVRVLLSDQAGLPLAGQDITLQLEAVAASDLGLRGARGNSWAANLAGTFARLRTDDDGEAQADLLAPAELSWRVESGPGQAASGTDLEALVPGELRTLVLVVPRRGKLAIQGRVVEADGGPPRLSWAEDLEVQAIPAGSLGADGRVFPAPGAAPVEAAPADEDGNFLITGLSPGSFVLQVRGTGLLVSGSALAGDSDVVLVMPPRRSVFVRVRDARSGAGVALAEVTVAQRNYEYSTFTGPDGGAALEAVAPSFDQIFVAAEGYAAVQWSLAGMTDEDLRHIQVDLERSRQLRVRFLAKDEEWKAVKSFVRSDWPWLEASRKLIAWTGEAKTLSLKDAPMASFALQALDRNGQPVGAPVLVPPGAEDDSLELSWSP